MARRWWMCMSVLVAAVVLSGCNPLALTVLGIGANTGVSHALGGIIYKTFTAPVQRVERASLVALRDMDIALVAKQRIEADQRVINARAREREIEILLEPLSSRTTRMRVIAHSGLLTDAATATEIVMQTERLLVARAGVSGSNGNGLAAPGRKLPTAAGGRIPVADDGSRGALHSAGVEVLWRHFGDRRLAR